MKKSRRCFLGSTAAAVAAPILTSGFKSNTKVHQSQVPPSQGPQLFVAALTMLDKKRRFDDAMNKDYLAYLAQAGVDGVLALGTTGEFPSFSVVERKRILESFARHSSNLTLICHVGTTNTPETSELLAHAADVGASSALIVPPFYFKKPSLDGLVAYYGPILEASRIPVLVYNIPQLSGVAISMELLQRLSKYEKLAGMKDSFNDSESHLALIRGFPGMKFLTGRTSVLSDALSAGGAGAITGSGSILPKETRAVFEAFRHGANLKRAQEQLQHAGTALRACGGIPGMKYALSFVGLAESYPRPPYVELSSQQKGEASKAWSHYSSLGA